MNNLPLGLKYLGNYQNLTEKKISSIHTKLMILACVLLIAMVSSFFFMFVFLAEGQLSNFSNAILGFIISATIMFLYIMPKVDSLDLLENSSKENIQKFNMLKNRKVAADYLKDHVLPSRSIHIFDQVIIEHLIDQEEIKNLMNIAKAV